MKKLIHKSLEETLDKCVPWPLYKKVFGTKIQKTLREICIKYGIYKLIRKTYASNAYEFAVEKGLLKNRALNFIEIKAIFDSKKIGQGKFYICHTDYWINDIAYQKEQEDKIDNEDKRKQEKLRARYYKKR